MVASVKTTISFCRFLVIIIKLSTIMPRKLSIKETITFVELYRSHECLWKYSSEDYKKKEKRRASLEDIKQQMKFENIEEVQKKIKSIRDTYNAEKTKIKKSMKSGAGIEDVYKPQLAWFNIAEFLSYSSGRESFDSISTQQNNNDQIISGQIEINQVEAEQYIEQRESEHSTEFSVDSNTTQITENKYGSSVNKKPESNRYTGSRKRKLKTEEEGQSFGYINKALEKLEQIKQSTEIKDEFFYFGQNIATQLRTLPTIVSLSLQKQMQQLIIDERLRLQDSAQNFSEGIMFESGSPLTPTPGKNSNYNDMLRQALLDS